MSRIAALRLAFIGLTIFAATGLLRDGITHTLFFEIGYRYMATAQLIGFLMALYGFYRYLALRENRSP